jgi:hypothetical protein
MPTTTKPSTYSLNQKQQYILRITCKFRFITAPLFAKHKSITSSSANTVLLTLHKKGYLGRHYNKTTYKLPNRPAEYFLTTQAIRYLRAQDNAGISDKSLNVCYSDKHPNEKFQNTSLLVYKTFIELKQKYPDYTFFTANNLREYDYYPETLPQLYFYKEDEYGERT